jgi:anti-sigma-K factor RskA
MSVPPDRTDHEEPPSDDLMAAEHVLGVTDELERVRARRRLLQEPEFAEQVRHWERRLAPLALRAAPAEVPSQVWHAIRARLGWLEETPAGFWSSVAPWRWLSGTLAALALAALIIDLRPRLMPPPEAAVTKPVTTLSRQDGTTAWLVTVDAQRGTVQMVPVPSTSAAQDRAAELWLIPPGQAPRSLGAVSLSRAHTVDVPAALRAQLTAAATLAITLEPSAGLPHAAPSGPVIASGMIVL